jgi:hypothetical protein
MDLTIWIPLTFALGLIMMGLFYAFMKFCEVI